MRGLGSNGTANRLKLMRRFDSVAVRSGRNSPRVTASGQDGCVVSSRAVDWKTILGLSVLGALVTTVGSLLATVVKDFLLARSLERFKTQQQLRQVYLKLRDPLLLSTIDLVNRIAEIAFESTVNFLDPALLQASASRMTENSAHDLYYQRYKFVSTSYRLCVWFGWVEMYRQETTFLDSGQRKTNEDFEHHVQAMRSSLADGHLNDADDWLAWTDSLIFREEQRAIGERMLDASRRAAIGYAEFNTRLIPSGSHPTDPWIRLAVDFLSDLKSIPDADERDFRRARCLLLIKHGVP